MHSKDIKQVENYIIILLTSWRLTSFPDPYRFFYRNDIDNFATIQHYSLDSMLTEDTESTTNRSDTLLKEIWHEAYQIESFFGILKFS